jgi:molybdate transport system regulatory protein
MKRPVVRVHIWMESGGETLLGLGRVQLLERIEELGSLKQAAESLGMSYRAAWGKIKQSEKTLGFQLVNKEGCNKCGYRLTVFGKCLTDAYSAWFKEVERHACEMARNTFPFDPLTFSDQDGEGEGEDVLPDISRFKSKLRPLAEKDHGRM